MESAVSAGLPPPPSLAQLEALDRPVLDALRERLRAAEYTPAILQRAEQVIPGQLDASRLPLVHWHLERDHTPASDLALLFSYYGALPRRQVEALLGVDVLGALERAAVLCDAPERNDHVIASCELLPFETLWLLADYPSAGPDTVMGPGGTTGEVTHLMPPAMSGSMYDAGCGAGSLALVAAARGCSPVCGSDINPRAVAIARLNATLNQLSAEFLTGDWTAPVRGRQFDWVMAQPPYVIQPPDVEGVTYLHGGPRGDRLVRQLLGELPAILAPGGRALILIDAAIEPGVPLHHPVREALGDATLDLVALVAPGISADLQARAYAAIDDPALGARFVRNARRYREHLGSLGDPEFRHMALLIARARREGDASPLTAMLPVRALRGGARRNVVDVLDAMALAHAGDAELKTATLRVSGWARWTQELDRPDPASPGRTRVQFEPGALGMDQELSGASLALLSTMLTSCTLEVAIERYAALCDATTDEVREQVTGFVRGGLATGMIEPA